MLRLYKGFSLFLVLYLSFYQALFGQGLIEKTLRDFKTLSSNSGTNAAGLMIQKRKLTGQLFTPTELFTFKSDNYTGAHSQEVKKAIALNLNRLALKETLSQKPEDIIFNIPVDAKRAIQLELTRVRIRTDDFILSTSDGGIFSSEDFPGLYYQGVVSGQANSLAAVSIFDGLVMGVISDDKGNYVLGRIGNKSNDYILYNDKYLNRKLPFHCASPDIESAGLLDKPSGLGEKSLQEGGGCIQVYIECDYEMYRDHGSDLTNVHNYMSGLFNTVSLIYRNEVIATAVSEINIWLTPDPYRAFDKTSDMLNEFAKVHQPGFYGNLAHLVSARNIAGGIAKVDQLCETPYKYLADRDGDGEEEWYYSGPFAVSADFNSSFASYPRYSWEVSTFAHEMGHNLGSLHTHSCFWEGGPIDNCFCPEDGNCNPGPEPPNSGGTIMSYCHLRGGTHNFGEDSSSGCTTPSTSNPGVNLSAGFGRLPGDFIRNRYNRARCMSQCDCGEISWSFFPFWGVDFLSTGYYMASDYVEAHGFELSSVQVNPGETVVFHAGNYIDLKPGFEVNGGDFTARTANCRWWESQEKFFRRPALSFSKKMDEFSSEKETMRQLSIAPNPFSRQTTISYTLTQTTQVKITLYNALGTPLGILVNDLIADPKRYDYVFDRADFPPGLYFIRLNIGKSESIRKIIITGN